MSVENPYPEHNTPTADALAWLGGTFEAGGTVTFRIQRYPLRNHADAYPLIYLNETRVEFMDSVYQLFGGNYRSEGNAYRWTLFGYKAAELILATEPYNVSRKEMTVAVQNWLNSTTDERVQIAEEMKTHSRYQEGSVEEYQLLLENPNFTAGVIDYRGLIVAASHDGGYHPRVDLSSKNHKLLLALQQRFHGIIRNPSKKGTLMTVGERTGVTKHDALLWSVSNNSARELIEYALPHLKIPPYLGWDRRISNEKRDARTVEINNLVKFIEDELARFENGEITRLSTNDELADVFDISKQGVKRKIGALDGDSRHKRHQLLLTQNAIDHNEKYGNPAKKKNI